MAAHRSAVLAGMLLVVAAHSATAQGSSPAPDSARAQISAVLRAFYLHLANQDWEALGAYVLSPKLLERRGAPGDLQTAARDRTRGRASSHRAPPPRECPSRRSPVIAAAVIRVDGDWAEVSVPRCSGDTGGVDEFRMLYFENRWRFIYTDLFQPEPAR